MEYSSSRKRDLEYVTETIKASQDTGAEMQKRHPELTPVDYGKMSRFIQVLSPRDGEEMIDFAERVYAVWKFSEQYTAGSTQGA